MAQPPTEIQKAPWRADIPEKFKTKIAQKQPFQVNPLTEYLLSCNEAVRKHIVLPYIEKSGPLVRSSEQFDVKIQQCTDSRHVTTLPSFYLDNEAIHRRTAGSIVGNGRGFKDVRPGGSIVVEGHKACGACAAAHEFEKKPVLSGIDENILQLITSIPYNAKRLADASVRDRENPYTQAFFIRRLLKLLHNRTDIGIFPAYHAWGTDKLGNPESYAWLGENEAELPSGPIKASLPAGAGMMTGYALAEGRDFTTQYAAFTMLYDPYRLGRLNDPRAVFGSLGNEMFCVTADFRSVTHPKETGERLSRFSIASVFYAGYDASNGDFGHVSGVGGKDGTHILGIMDTSEDVLRKIKNHLLTYPLVKQLTDNGQKILAILYNKDNAEAKFVNLS